MLSTDLGEIRSYVSDAQRLGEVAFDTETDGLKPFEGDRICMYSMYHPELGGLAVPVRMHNLFAVNAPPDAIQALAPLFAAGGPLVIGHHLVFDLSMMMVEDIDVLQARVWDTQYGAFLYRDDLESYALKGDKALSMSLLKDKKASNEADELAKWTGHAKNKGKPWSMTPVELLAGRAVKDVELTWNLQRYLVARFQAERPNYQQLIDLEMRWVKLLARMQGEGLLWDADRSAEIRRSFEQRLMTIHRDKLHPIGFTGVNCTPAQVMKFVRGRGEYIEDTEELSLTLVKDRVPEVADILEFRKRSRVISSGLNPLDEHARLGNGKIHTSFGGTGHKSYSNDAHDSGSTRTGRVRTGKPNVQGIPVYDPDIERTKECFVAPPGYLLGAIDISQADIRLAAHYMGDDRLIEELSKPDGDLHTMISNETGIPRTRAKRIVFGAGLYGAGDEKAAQSLMEESGKYVSPEEAGALKRIFHSKYPLFRKALKDVERVAKNRKYIMLWDGRRVYVANDEAHKAWNWLIQGGVAALVKRWMLEIEEYIDERDLLSRIILQVHDEVILSMPKKEVHHLNNMAGILERIAQEAEFKLPFFTSVKAGPRWSEMKPIAA